MSTENRPVKKQSLPTRVLFFAIGGALSSGLNTGIFKFFSLALHLPRPGALACSILTTTVIFFLWSYHINFRTSQVWKNCIGRYLTCVATCQLTNYAVVSTCMSFWGSEWKKLWLINVGVMSVTGGVKFLLYHFWVFPPGKDAELVPAIPEALAP